jgi:hypothetical protein
MFKEIIAVAKTGVFITRTKSVEYYFMVRVTFLIISFNV